jgi:hypothetical protein
MKRFRFPLDRVRKWRQDQAGLEEMRLRQLYAEIRAAEADRQATLDEDERSRRAVLHRQYVAAEDLSSLEAFKKYAVEHIRRLDVRRRALSATIVEQQARVLEAHRSVRLLDGLHDRALLGWTAARDKEQEELAAELYLARWSRGVGDSQLKGQAYRAGKAAQAAAPGSKESRSLERGSHIKSTGVD